MKVEFAGSCGGIQPQGSSRWKFTASAHHFKPKTDRDRVWLRELVGSTMSDEELKAELERLRNENAALKKGAPTGIRMKVSEKGAVSIYGMGRFPVTLYKEQ